MKKLLLILTPLLLAISSVKASTPYSYTTNDTSFYLQVLGGFTINTNSDFATTNVPGVVGNSKTEPDNGYQFIGAFGLKMHRMRLELEYSYRGMDLGTITGAYADALGGSGNLGDLSYHSVMLNVLYDVPLGEAFYMYMGAGIGYSFVTMNAPVFGGDDDTDAAFAFQLMLGFGYNITRDLSLVVGYRFFKTDDLNYSMGQIFEGNQVAMEAPSVNAIEIGLRLDF